MCSHTPSDNSDNGGTDRETAEKSNNTNIKSNAAFYITIASYRGKDFHKVSYILFFKPTMSD